MPDYYVEWSIELKADTPKQAAEKALQIQRDPESFSTVFDVIGSDGEPHRINLLETENYD